MGIPRGEPGKAMKFKLHYPMLGGLMIAACLAGAPEPPSPEPPAEPEPIRVFLGVDCSKPFMVGLPDHVLTECETE